MYIPVIILLLIASPFLLVATIVMLAKRKSVLKFLLVQLAVLVVYITYLIQFHHYEDDITGAEKIILPAIFISVHIVIVFLLTLYLPKKRIQNNNKQKLQMKQDGTG